CALPILFGAGAGADGLLAAMTPVESVPSIAHLVADAELAEVEACLGGVDFTRVVPAYRSATRERPLEAVGFRTALEAFDHLRELAAGPDGLPPEVVFTEEVAKLRPVSRGTLRGYADSRGPDEVPREALRRLRARPAPRPPAAARLEIIAEPLPGGGEPRYEVRSRLRAGGSATPPRTARVGEAGLPGEALEIVREAELLLGRGPYPPPVPMTLDFYLPLPLLLSGGIAHWRVRTPASPHGERLGSAYRLVLHSYERAFAPHWCAACPRRRRRAARTTPWPTRGSRCARWAPVRTGPPRRGLWSPHWRRGCRRWCGGSPGPAPVRAAGRGRCGKVLATPGKGVAEVAGKNRCSHGTGRRFSISIFTADAST